MRNMLEGFRFVGRILVERVGRNWACDKVEVEQAEIRQESSDGLRRAGGLHRVTSRSCTGREGVCRGRRSVSGFAGGCFEYSGLSVLLWNAGGGR